MTNFFSIGRGTSDVSGLSFHPSPPSREIVPWDSCSHSRLVRKIQDGDQSALAWVVNTYRPALLRYAQRLLQGVAEPEDIVQEAFVRFWARRSQLRPGGSVRALLFISVRTIARDEYRMWGKRVQLSADLHHLNGGDTPFEHLVARELHRSLGHALDGLSPRRRQIFRMVREEGMTHAEAAETLGITTRTVKNTMSSALSELRDRLGPALQS